MLGKSNPDRHIQDLMGQLIHPGHNTGASGNDHPGCHQFMVMSFFNFTANQFKNFTEAVFYDSSKDHFFHLAVVPPSNAGDGNHFVLVRHVRKSDTVTVFDFLSLLERGSKPDSDVVGQMIPSQCKDRSVDNAPL